MPGGGQAGAPRKASRAAGRSSGSRWPAPSMTFSSARGMGGEFAAAFGGDPRVVGAPGHLDGDADRAVTGLDAVGVVPVGAALGEPAIERGLPVGAEPGVQHLGAQAGGTGRGDVLAEEQPVQPLRQPPEHLGVLTDQREELAAPVRQRHRVDQGQAPVGDAAVDVRAERDGAAGIVRDDVGAGQPPSVRSVRRRPPARPAKGQQDDGIGGRIAQPLPPNLAQGAVIAVVQRPPAHRRTPARLGRPYGERPTHRGGQKAAVARTLSIVSASVASLSGRWRSTRAKRRARPPG